MKSLARFLLPILLTLATVCAVKAEQVIISEIMYNPTGTKPEYIEVKNVTYTPRDIAKWKFTQGITFEFPEFSSGTAHLLSALEPIIISSSDPATTRAAYPHIPSTQRVFGPWVGTLSNSGERITLNDKNGVSQTTVNYGSTGRWPAAPDGVGHSLVILNENCDADDFHNWKASSGARGGTTVQVFDYSTTWKYLLPANNVFPNNWNTSGFDDTLWSSGGGFLGRESGNINIPAPGMVTNTFPQPSVSQSVALFRKTFNYSGTNPSSATVAIDHAVDDGVTYYLNGQLLGSVHHTPGNLLANSGLPGGDITGEVLDAVVKAGSTGLINGTNVISAEVHQITEGSSDVVFGARLRISEGGGTPSTAKLRINELHFTGSTVNWVEIQNYSTSSHSASGLYLATQKDLFDKVALSGTVNAGAYASFNTTFAADGSGNITIYLVDSSNNVLDAHKLQQVAGRNSLQAIWPPQPVAKPAWHLFRQDAEWYGSTSFTQNVVNAPAGITTAIVINEIMCDPMSEQQQAKYIELYNNSASPVSVAGWKLRNAVDFDFPTGTSIPANGYLIVASNKTYLQGVFPSATIVGDWDGKLSGNADYIRLVDQNGNLADEVDYKVGGDWPEMKTFKGSSLELINPNMDNNRASAWRASDESNKTSFANYKITGTYQENAGGRDDTFFGTTPGQPQTLNAWGASQSDYRELQMYLNRDGEVIVKNVKITTDPNGGGSNMLSNPNVKSSNGSSSSGWLCQGTHGESWMDGGTSELHIVSTGHGNMYPNHCEVDATANGSIQPGTQYTISFDARWVRGYPRLISHIWNYSIGGSLMISVPNNLGTAGSVNSRYNSTTPPQVDSVLHSPAVPKSTDAVKVTARVTAPGTPTVQVFHRADSVNNGNSYSQQTMFDDGTNGDVIANDGVYTASVTSHQVNNRVVQFYVRATHNSQTSLCPPTPLATGANGELNPHPAMWVVDNRTIPSNHRRQRFILSANTIDRMKSNNSPSFGAPKPEYNYKHGRVSNDKFPAVFIHNESDVYYQCEFREGGSRWHRTLDAKLEAAKWKIPDDRLFRKHGKFAYDHDLDYGQDYYNGGPPYPYAGGINTRVICYLLYLMGYESVNEAEWAWTILNPSEYPDYDLKVDDELTDNDLISRTFENGSNGELYKVFEKWWLKDDYGDTFGQPDWVYKGTHDQIRYIQDYPLRSQELDSDYAPLTDMFKIVSDSGSSRELQERAMDIHSILIEEAVRGVCGDWDRGSKNGYIYRRPDNNKMTTLNWDNDASFTPNDGNNMVINGQSGPQPGSPGNGTALRPMFGTWVNQPWIRRYINYYLTELIDGYANSGNSRLGAWLTAQKNAPAAAISTRNGMYDPDKNITELFYKEWFDRRRQDVLDTINQNVGTGGAGSSYSATFAITSPANGSSTGSNTITIVGTAPSKAFAVAVDNQPDAVLTWTNQVNWSLSNVVLKTGTNNFVIRMLNAFGAAIPGNLNLSVTKTGNAVPIVTLNADPNSYNVTLGEVLTLDASTSYDPDSTALTFGWSNTPNTGLTVTTPTAIPVNSKSQATFTTPGIYSFTVTVTDAGAGSTPVTREINVANTADFESFNNKQINTTVWSTLNTGGGSTMDSRAAVLSSRWYSLYDIPGSLVIGVQDGSPKALSHTNNQPVLLRSIPANTDCAILTEVTTVSRKTGSFFTGLYIEGNEAEGSVKYAFGLDGGTTIKVRRLTSGGITEIFSAASTGIDAKLRIRRVGNNLRFERRTTGSWTTLHTRAMSGSPSLSKGGIFLSTSAAENARASFDYIMVVDPTNVGDSVYNNLRITELMYNPRGASEAEYIEVRNIGGATINLNGVKIDNGITMNITTDVFLVAGAHGVFTENSTAFTAQFPGVTVLKQWESGSLSNGGEKIVLKDADNNIIHEFTYSDQSPWPTAADGTGAAMEVISTSGDYSSASNWRATGAAPGGGTDTDGDGVPDAWEAKFGTNTTDPLSKPQATTSVNGSNQTQINWGGINGQNYRVEYCDNLGDAWQTISGGGSVAGVNGTVSFTDPQLPRPTKRFYRIMAL